MTAEKRDSNADELLAENIREMGEPLGRVYNALYNELAWLHIDWKLYRQLFAKSQERIDVLNKVARHFFRVTQRALADDVMLHIGRMTDPPETGRRTPQRNLTIQRLPALVPKELKADIAKLSAEAMTACGPIRLSRNRRLAHRDLQIAIAAAPLPGVTLKQIDQTLAAFTALLNRIELHYRMSKVAYMYTVMPTGDADSLVRYLVKGLRQEEARRQRLRRGKPLPEDLEPEEIP